MKENMEKIREITRISIFEVFENMFYVFLEPLDVQYDEYDMEAAIRFHGAVSGEVRILVSRDLVKTMAQNMLSLGEDEITGEDIEDCSKEAVNMICGNLLGKLDSANVFNLSLPTFNDKSTNHELAENICRMDFNSDNGKVGVTVRL